MSAAVRWLAPALDTLDVAPAPARPDGPDEVIDLPTPPSLEEIQRIRDEAQRDGHAAGFAEGLASGQTEIRRLTAQIEGILDNFSRPLARLENEVVAALGDLAVRIAGSLVGRAYETDPALLADLVADAIDAVGGLNREVEVRLHPDDIAAVEPLLALGDGSRLVADHALARGDLRVHAECVRLDGSLDARLRGALESVLQRARAGA